MSRLARVSRPPGVIDGSRVLVLQAMCKQYRAPLFARMQQELATDGIELLVAYSPPAATHVRRRDDVDLPAPYGLRVGARSCLGGRLLWQSALSPIRSADLVIVEHAVKHLINLPLLAASRLGIKKLGFWMHGGTLRHASSPLLRPWRRQTMLAGDWIFAYTTGVAQAAAALGADPARITPLQNAIDLSSFRAALAAVSDGALASARARLGIPNDARVALFCGSLYPGRGVDFLVEAGDRIAERLPRFHLIVIGSGPLENELARAAAARPWLHALSSVFDGARALYFRLANVCLMPYLAGLGILDAMAAGLPYIVTGERATNPEIEYMVDGVTGLATGDSAERFAAAVADLLLDEARLKAMSEAARVASGQYSIEAMSANFCTGIRGCLAAPARSSLAAQRSSACTRPNL